MPLHAMSTSYVRGNQTSKTPAHQVKHTGGAEQAVEPRPSESLARSSLGPSEGMPVGSAREDPSGLTGKEPAEGASSVKGSDEECCFGILRCDEGQEDV